MESRESSVGVFLRVLQNFQEHLFCRASVNAYLHEMKHEKTFSPKYIQKKTPVMVLLQTSQLGRIAYRELLMIITFRIPTFLEVQLKIL